MYAEDLLLNHADALDLRNRQWTQSRIAPSWVDLSEVGLDQFFTTPHVAADCYAEMRRFLAERGDDASAFDYIEPSAGSGAFYDLLPIERRTGIDVLPLRRDFVRSDFLTWSPEAKQGNIVIGNPPFGYRAWLALAFVNHAAKFADHIGMILPMAFQSDGKGSPKHRVKGMALQSSRILPPESFVDAMGRAVKVNALWQIWSKGENTSAHRVSCSDWVELFTVDQRKERLCGQAKMADADWFLQRTFYHEPPSLVKSFSQVRYVCGYGLIIKRAKREITKHLQQVDWLQYSNLAAHNCRHISMYHIERALVDGGYVNA
ncbi:MAG: hypothetical protein CVT85_08760 [Alphaproteobacteria bacterium HGW-Alphaproteobacteria-7]|jgi:hypothetical protein|nr:MAG: hypothetical protein CVT85_08760 [Alphaproteobacteria bacterium HGW-Alphaproteobacteria-7]